MILRKKTWDLLHFWQARKRKKIILDKALIHGFYEPILQARITGWLMVFSWFCEYENGKEDSRGNFFINLVSRVRKSIKQFKGELSYSR